MQEQRTKVGGAVWYSIKPQENPKKQNQLVKRKSLKEWFPFHSLNDMAFRS